MKLDRHIKNKPISPFIINTNLINCTSTSTGQAFNRIYVHFVVQVHWVVVGARGVDVCSVASVS